VTGPLAQQFAQLGETLDFLREIENGTRCGTCQRPHATDADWQRYNEGEGAHLCWETVCSHEPDTPTALERLAESLAALSAIERHVQDMETALREIQKQAVAGIASTNRLPYLTGIGVEAASALAALPASREKGEK
jgi:hypothetical protein